MRLVTWAWWKATLIRAGRTAGVIAIPYAATVFYVSGDWLIALSAAGFGALGSVITALIQVPSEATGKAVPWWYALGERTVKTLAQSLGALFGTATLFEQVDWSQAPALVGTAVVGSLLLGFMGFLPETEGDRPLAPTEIRTVTTKPDGEEAETVTPVVASADVQIISGDSGSVG